MVDCYVMLGIPRSASQAEIKKAYHAKSKELHPDSMEGAESVFGAAYCDMVQVNLCYDALTKSRDEYNEENSWRWPAPPMPEFDNGNEEQYFAAFEEIKHGNVARREYSSDEFFDGITFE